MSTKNNQSEVHVRLEAFAAIRAAHSRVSGEQKRVWNSGRKIGQWDQPEADCLDNVSTDGVWSDENG